MKDFHVIHSFDGVNAYETYPSMLDYLAGIRDLLMEGETSESDMADDLAAEYRAVQKQISEIGERGTDDGMVAHCPSWEVRGGFHRHQCSIEIAAYWTDFVPQAIAFFLDNLKAELDRNHEAYQQESEGDEEPTRAVLEQCKASWATMKKTDTNSEGFTERLKVLLDHTIEDCLPTI
jgi:hypothetical protein